MLNNISLTVFLNNRNNTALVKNKKLLYKPVAHEPAVSVEPSCDLTENLQTVHRSR